MAKATKFQKDFAKSRMEYFKYELNEGKGDAIKPFVKALLKKDSGQDFAAENVMTAVNTAKTNSDNAEDNYKILNQIAALPTTYDGTKTCAKTDKTADKFIGLCAGDEALRIFFNAIYSSKTGYTAVEAKDQIQTLLGQVPEDIGDAAAVDGAITSYFTAVGASDNANKVEALGTLAKILGLTDADGTNTAGVLFKDADGTYSATAIENNKGFTELAGSNAQKVTKKTAAIKAYLSTTTAFHKTNGDQKGNEVKISGDKISTLFSQAEKILTDAITIKVDADEAINAQTEAQPVYDALFTTVAAKVQGYTYTTGSSKTPKTEDEAARKVMADNVPKDKATLDSWNALFSKFDAGTQKNLNEKFDANPFVEADAATPYKAGMKEVLKGYDLINQILKNIPSKGTGVLTRDTGSDGDPFTKFASSLTNNKLEAAQFYLDLVLKVCGVAPFDWDKITKDLNLGTQTCATQVAAIAAVILNHDGCGSDQLENGGVKDTCYENIIGKLGDAWFKTDELKVDLESEYPDNIIHDDL